MNRSRNLVIGGLLAAVLTVPFAPAQAHEKPSLLHLPDGWHPEGIATIGRTAYVGSLVDGDIYALNLKTGEGRVVSQGPGTPAVGLEATHGRLWVAGGPSGTGRFVDPRTGETLASVTLTTNPSFINDVVAMGQTAWFTDSMQAQLYSVRHSDGSVTTIPLTGAWVQTPAAFNANGIERTPDGSALLVINSSNGTLYRVDPTTGAATVVAGGTGLVNGDGLLLQGNTLYVVQNQSNKVAVLDISDDGTAAEWQREITSPDFQVPSTVARWGHRLYLPNAQFGVVDNTFEVIGVNAR
jgi:sugar lactone lactonase YvrE